MRVAYNRARRSELCGWDGFAAANAHRDEYGAPFFDYIDGSVAWPRWDLLTWEDRRSRRCAAPIYTANVRRQLRRLYSDADQPTWHAHEVTHG